MSPDRHRELVRRYVMAAEVWTSLVAELGPAKAAAIIAKRVDAARKKRVTRLPGALRKLKAKGVG